MFTLERGTQVTSGIYAVDSNADIYVQLIYAEIIETLGGQYATGIANLGLASNEAATAVVVAGLSFIPGVGPGTTGAFTAFLTVYGPERFWRGLANVASLGVNPAPNYLVFGNSDKNLPAGTFSSNAQIKIGRQLYRVQPLDPFELSGLITWLAGVPNVNWVASWEKVGAQGASLNIPAPLSVQMSGITAGPPKISSVGSATNIPIADSSASSTQKKSNVGFLWLLAGGLALSPVPGAAIVPAGLALYQGRKK